MAIQIKKPHREKEKSCHTNPFPEKYNMAISYWDRLLLNIKHSYELLLNPICKNWSSPNKPSSKIYPKHLAVRRSWIICKFSLFSNIHMTQNYVSCCYKGCIYSKKVLYSLIMQLNFPLRFADTPTSVIYPITCSRPWPIRRLLRSTPLFSTGGLLCLMSHSRLKPFFLKSVGSNKIKL